MSITTIVFVAALWVTPMYTECPLPEGLTKGDKVDFHRVFDKMMYDWENDGEYHRDPRGIETKWGVASTAYPDLDIKALTKPEAMEIARSNYWVPARVTVAPPKVQYALFDMAYNAGTATAVRLLQRAMNNVVAARGYDWDPLTTDGQAGPKTQQRMLALHREDAFVLRCFVYQRMDYYTSLLQARPEEYGTSYNGWLRRALEAV